MTMRLIPLALLVAAVTGGSAAEPKELKIIAQHRFGVDRDGPPILWDLPAEPLAIRSAEELAAVVRKKKDAKDPAVQKEAEELLTKAFKMEKIDWDKQMVVAVAAKRPMRGADIWEFKSLKVEGESLTVEWGSVKIEKYYEGKSAAVAVVERFNGKVVFKPVRSK